MNENADHDHDLKGSQDTNSIPERPRIRPVEALPAGEGLVCLRDPHGFSDKLLVLPPRVLFLVSLFDGTRSLQDLQIAYTRRFGDMLLMDKLREIVGQLDSALLLDSPRYRQTRERIVEEFRSSPLREATHAGTAYRNDPAELAAQLEELFAGCEPLSPPLPEGRPAGLIAPHIDLARGGACYAKSYSALSAWKQEAAKRPVTFVVLGIAHAPMKRRFAVTAKNFETPFSPVPADREMIEQIRERCSTDFFEDEFAHRAEHSVEFQVVFLRHLFPDQNIRIVPVLCTIRKEDMETSPSEDPEFREFTSVLGDLIGGRDDVCLIAGVDLSHLGKRFGQDIKLSDAFLEQTRRQDMDMIDLILKADPEEFMRHIQREGQRQNVCGTPALYTLLTLLRSSNSRLIMYDQAADRENDSVVTFMGAALYR